MQKTYYPEKIMYYLKEVPNSGVLHVDNQTVFMAETGSISNDLKISLYIKIENAIILQVSYLVYGDGYIIAALGMLSQELCGLRLKRAANYSFSKLAEILEIPPAKNNSLKLIRQLIDNIRSQYNSSQQL